LPTNLHKSKNIDMSLNKTGKKVLKEFKKEYGEKKGKSVFYAKENKSKSFANTVAKRKR